MTAESLTGGDRRSSNLAQLIALYMTILVNVAVIVWGAATLRAEVTTLRETVTPLVGEVQEIRIEQAIQRDREARSTAKGF